MNPGEMLLQIKAQTKSISFVFCLCCIALTALLVCNEFGMFLSCPIQANDEICYEQAYFYKLVTEGRWIVYLLSPSLIHVSGALAVLMNLACLFFFSLVVFRNLLPRHVAVLAALCALLFPPVHSLNNWALTLLPSYIVLAAAALCYRRMPMAVFFCLFGCLFNGGVSHFYFLLPLLFLKEKEGFIKLLVLWCGGFVCGFVCAEVMTKLLSHSFIQLAEWREPHYIRSLSDAVANAQRLMHSAERLLPFLGKLIPLFMLTALVSMVVSAVRRGAGEMKKGILLVLIAASVFAQAFPAGLHVYLRTQLCVFFAASGLIVAGFRKYPAVLTLMLLCMVVQFDRLNAEDMRYWNFIGNKWSEEMRQIPVSPYDVKGVIMLSSDDEFRIEEKRLCKDFDLTPNISIRRNAACWTSAPLHMGYAEVYTGQRALARMAEAGIAEEQLSFADVPGYSYAVANGYLVLKIR